METDPPKKEEESEEESEEKSDKKSEPETKDNIIINLEKKLEKSDNSIENEEDDKDLEQFTEKCDLLKMITVPTFGKYSTDYSFLEQILVLKSKSKFENLPELMKNKLDNLQKKYPKINPE